MQQPEGAAPCLPLSGQGASGRETREAGPTPAAWLSARGPLPCAPTLPTRCAHLLSRAATTNLAHLSARRPTYENSAACPPNISCQSDKNQV